MMRISGFILLASLLLPGCNSGDAVLEDLPPGSVKVEGEMYMIPLEALDEDGCQGYRAYSPGKMVVQVIFYERPDGTFTMSKAEAACHADRQ